jgi:hypothetical protein
VAVLGTIALDLVLAFTLLLSAQIAAGWGELAGIRPGRDKSGLGGFVAIFALFAVRWLALAGLLLAVARPGETAWLLGAHAALGAVSVLLFQHGIARVQADRWAPQAPTVLGGVVVPVPAFALVLQRVNAGWLAGDGGAGILAALAGAMLALHGACYRARRRDLLNIAR